MKTKMFIVLLATMPLLVKADLFGNYWQTKKLALDTQGITSFVADTGAGDIDISGRDDIEEISVTAKFGGRELDADEYELRLERNGNEAIFVSKIDSGWNSNVYIDVDIVVPARLAIKIDDRSGDLSVSDIDNQVKIDDRSGDLSVRNISSDLNIDDRSGDIDISKVSGALVVDDRSGDIRIRNVQGNVKVEDNSGDIRIHDSGANVSVEDSSGDIEIENTKGIVNIIDSGGDVDVDGAQDVDLDKRGGGDIDTRNIRKSRK